MERAPLQVERHDAVTELADVARQREARVAAEGDRAALRLHADELERELTCVEARLVALLVLHGGLTSMIAVLNSEHTQDTRHQGRS